MGRPPLSHKELGVDGGYDYRYGSRLDDLIPALRGHHGIRKYREMRDNDPVIGAILASIEMLSRGAKWKFAASSRSKAAREGAAFAQSIFDDMELTFDDFLTDAMSMLPYGFSLFEIVLNRTKSGGVGIAKLAPRPQWTIESFTYPTTNSGTIDGVVQQTTRGTIKIPASRLLHLRATSSNNDPYGRSILRNAYRSYVYVTHITEYEAIAIERELNGLPVGRIPADYMKSDASPEKILFFNKMKEILRDVKKNEQGYVIIPSDVYEDEDGKPSAVRMVDFELLASKGTRDIDTGKTVVRHQQDIARTVMADFLMLGQNDRGSFAMSKSKSDIFVKAMRSFLNAICAPINKQLLPMLWELNGLPENTRPTLVYENLAAVDLAELGLFIKNISAAGADLFDKPAPPPVVPTTAGAPPTAVDVNEPPVTKADGVSAGKPKPAAPGKPQKKSPQAQNLINSLLLAANLPTPAEDEEDYTNDTDDPEEKE